jgi:Bacterial PH domain
LNLCGFRGFESHPLRQKILFRACPNNELSNNHGHSEHLFERLIGNVSIPLDGIRAIRKTTADDLRGCIRLWGSGGLFGYYGLFRTSALGKSTWYVTNRRNIVVVITASKTALFSPDDVDAFLAAIHTKPDAPLACLEAAFWLRRLNRHPHRFRGWHRGDCVRGVRHSLFTRPAELHIDTGSSENP